MMPDCRPQLGSVKPILENLMVRKALDSLSPSHGGALRSLHEAGLSQSPIADPIRRPLATGPVRRLATGLVRRLATGWCDRSRPGWTGLFTGGWHCEPNWSNGDSMPDRDVLHVGHPDAAGWVLGALDPDEAERFKAHLESCDDCRAAVAELQPVTRMLEEAAAVAEHAAVAEPAAQGEPPADLRARTLASVERAKKAV